MFAELVG